MKKPLKRIAITGAGGQIAYNLLFRIASGEMLGLDQPIALHLLETSFGFDALKGVVMELEDCCYPLLREIRIGTDPIEIFEDIDYALLVGAKPRSMDMERKDLLADNGKIFIEQGKALDKVASKQVLTLVVGNPCNTNCWIALEHAPSINKRQFFAMTLLDQNRASYQLSRKASVGVERVSHVAIWGNHSSTQVPDFHNAKISGKPAEEMIGDQKWLETDFIHTIQRRGAEIIQARGKSSAASAAHAIIYTMRSLVFPTPKGEIFSCAIHSKGNPYGIAGELIFSFPCISKGEGKVEIVKGFSLTPFLKEKIVITQNELIEEKRVVIEALGL